VGTSEEDLSLSCQSFLWPAYEYYALEYKMLLATLPTFHFLHSTRLDSSRAELHPPAHTLHTIYILYAHLSAAVSIHLRRYNNAQWQQKQVGMYLGDAIRNFKAAFNPRFLARGGKTRKCE